MWGLIKKDMYLMKSNIKKMAIIFVTYIVLAIQGTFDSDVILPIMGMILLMTTFSYDDYNNWNAFAISLPSGKKNIVKAKYALVLMMIVISFVLSLIVSSLIAISKDNFNLFDCASSIFGSILGVVLIIIILYPLIFKYGVEKGKIALFAVIFGGALVVSLAAMFISTNPLKPVFEFLDNHMILLPLIVLLLLFISYKVSEKIFMKREF